MFGTFSFSDTTFAESKLKNRNNLEYNIDLEVQTLDKIEAQVNVKAEKELEIDITKPQTFNL